MRLPGLERGVIDVAKVRDYLLSSSHPVGRYKAAFFISLGYSAQLWSRLVGDLQLHAHENDAVATQATAYGQKYEVRGIIRGPAGKAAALVAVWIVLAGQEFPRFVTAYPGVRS